eukprot:m.339064 g.339064  ORF g.339064 m.339064 type:complete len:4099 (+) comp16090_c0_seq1:289-12585(+)
MLMRLVFVTVLCAPYVLAQCHSPGAVLLEERFEGAEWQHSTYYGKDNAFAVPTNGWTVETDIPSMTQVANLYPEMAGWNLWQLNIYGYVRSQAGFHGGIAMSNMDMYFDQHPDASTTQYSSTLRSPMIDLSDLCALDTLQISMSLYMSASSSCSARITFPGSSASPVDLVSSSESNAVKTVEVTVPADATQAQLEFHTGSSRYELFALDNVVVTAGVFQHDCSSKPQNTSVWIANTDGVYDDESNWCNGEIGDEGRDVRIECNPNLAECMVLVPTGVSVYNFNTADGVLVILRSSMSIFNKASFYNLRMESSGKLDGKLKAEVRNHFDFKSGRVEALTLDIKGTMMYDTYFSRYDIYFYYATVRFMPSTPTEYSLAQYSNDLASATKFHLNANSKMSWIALREYRNSLPEISVDGGELHVIRSRYNTDRSYITGLVLRNGATLDVQDSELYVSSFVHCLSSTITTSLDHAVFGFDGRTLVDESSEIRGNVSLRFWSNDIVLAPSIMEATNISVHGGSVQFHPNTQTPNLVEINAVSGYLTLPLGLNALQLKTVSITSGILRVLCEDTSINKFTLGSQGSSSGSLYLGSNLTVDSMLFNGGSVQAQENHVDLLVTTDLRFRSSGSKYLYGVNLHLPASVVTSFLEPAHFYVDDGGSVIVPASSTLRIALTNRYLFSSNQPDTAPSAMLVNYGTIDFIPQYKSSHAYLRAGLINDGAINIKGGTLRLPSSMVVSGNVTVDELATMYFDAEGSSACSGVTCAFLKQFTPTSRLMGTGTIYINDDYPAEVASAHIDATLTWQFYQGGLSIRQAGKLEFDEPVVVSSGTYIFDSAFTHLTSLELRGGLVIFKNGATVERLAMIGGTLEIHADNVFVNETRWLGGTIKGMESNSIEMANLTMCGSSSHYATDIQMHWTRGVSWSGSGGFSPSGSTQVTLAENATMDIRNSLLSFSSSSAEISFVNYGTVEVKPSELLGSKVYMQCGISNYGTFRLYGGDLYVSQLYHHKTLQLAGGSMLRITAQWRFIAGSVVEGLPGMGLGDLYITSAGTISSTFFRAREITTFANVKVMSTVKRFEAVSVIAKDDELAVYTGPEVAAIQSVDLLGGSLHIASALDVDSFSLGSSSSYVRVENNLRIAGDITWDSGRFRGVGRVEAFGRFFLVGTSMYFDGVDVIMHEGFTATRASSSLSFANGARLTTLEGSSSNVDVNSFVMSGYGVWLNNGLVSFGQPLYSGADSNSIGVTSRLGGTVEVMSGNLRLNRDISIAGRVNVAAGSIIYIYGDATFTPQSQVYGQGEVYFTGSSCHSVVGSKVFQVASLSVASSAEVTVNSQDTIAFRSIVVDSSALMIMDAAALYTESLITKNSATCRVTVGNFTAQALAVLDSGNFQLFGEGTVLHSFQLAGATVSGADGVLSIHDSLVALRDTRTSYISRQFQTTGVWVLSAGTITISDAVWETRGSLRLEDAGSISGNGYIVNYGVVEKDKTLCDSRYMPSLTLMDDAVLVVECGTLDMERLVARYPSANITVKEDGILRLRDDASLQAPLNGLGTLEVYSGRVQLAQVPQQISKVTTTGSNAHLHIPRIQAFQNLSTIHVASGMITVDDIGEDGKASFHVKSLYVSGDFAFSSPLSFDKVTLSNGRIRFLNAAMSAGYFAWPAGILDGVGSCHFFVTNGEMTTSSSNHLINSVQLILSEQFYVRSDDEAFYLKLIADALIEVRGVLHIQSGGTIYEEEGRPQIMVSGRVEFAADNTHSVYNNAMLKLLPGGVLSYTDDNDWEQRGALVLYSSSSIHVPYAAFYANGPVSVKDDSVSVHVNRLYFAKDGQESSWVKGVFVGSWRSNTTIVAQSGTIYMSPVFETSSLLLRAGLVLLSESVSASPPAITFEEGESDNRYLVSPFALTFNSDMLLGSSRNYFYFYDDLVFRGKVVSTGTYFYGYGLGSATFEQGLTLPSETTRFYGYTVDYRSKGKTMLRQSGASIYIDDARLYLEGDTRLDIGSIFSADSYGVLINQGTLTHQDHSTVQLPSWFINNGHVEVSAGQLDVRQSYMRGSLTATAPGYVRFLETLVWSPLATSDITAPAVYVPSGKSLTLTGPTAVSTYKRIETDRYYSSVTIGTPLSGGPVCIDTLYIDYRTNVRFAANVTVRSMFLDSYTGLYFEPNVHVHVTEEATGEVSRMLSAAQLTISETNSTLDTCLVQGDCHACTTTVGCGWDIDAAKCVAGDAAGPTIGSSCDWAGTSALCPAQCSSFTTKDQCSARDDESDCLWCEGSQSCVSRSDDACHTAYTIYWHGFSSSTFEDARNWVPARVPTAGDHVLISPNRSISITSTYSSSVLPLASLQIHSNAGEVTFNLRRPLFVAQGVVMSDDTTLNMYNYGRLIHNTDFVFGGRLLSSPNFDGSGNVLLQRVPETSNVRISRGNLTMDIGSHVWTSSATFYVCSSCLMEFLDTQTFWGHFQVEGGPSLWRKDLIIRSSPSTESNIEYKAEILGTLNVTSGNLYIRNGVKAHNTVYGGTNTRFVLDGSGYELMQGIETGGELVISDYADVYTTAGKPFVSGVKRLVLQYHADLHMDLEELAAFDYIQLDRYSNLHTRSASNEVVLSELRMDGFLNTTSPILVSGRLRMYSYGRFTGSGDVTIDSTDALFYGGAMRPYSTSDPAKRIQFNSAPTFVDSSSMSFDKANVTFDYPVTMSGERFCVSSDSYVVFNAPVTILGDKSSCGNAAVVFNSKVTIRASGNIYFDEHVINNDEILIESGGYVRFNNLQNNGKLTVLPEDHTVTLVGGAVFGKGSVVSSPGTFRFESNVQVDGVFNVHTVRVYSSSSFERTAEVDLDTVVVDRYDTLTAPRLNALRVLQLDYSSTANFGEPRVPLVLQELSMDSYSSLRLNTSMNISGDFKWRGGTITTIDATSQCSWNNVQLDTGSYRRCRDCNVTVQGQWMVRSYDTTYLEGTDLRFAEGSSVQLISGGHFSAGTVYLDGSMVVDSNRDIDMYSDFVVGLTGSVVIESGRHDLYRDTVVRGNISTNNDAIFAILGESDVVFEPSSSLDGNVRVYTSSASSAGEIHFNTTQFRLKMLDCYASTTYRYQSRKIFLPITTREMLSEILIRSPSCDMKLPTNASIAFDAVNILTGSLSVPESSSLVVSKEIVLQSDISGGGHLSTPLLTVLPGDVDIVGTQVEVAVMNVTSSSFELREGASILVTNKTAWLADSTNLILYQSSRFELSNTTYMYIKSSLSIYPGDSSETSIVVRGTVDVLDYLALTRAASHANVNVRSKARLSLSYTSLVEGRVFLEEPLTCRLDVYNTFEVASTALVEGGNMYISGTSTIHSPQSLRVHYISVGSSATLLIKRGGNATDASPVAPTVTNSMDIVSSSSKFETEVSVTVPRLTVGSSAFVSVRQRSQLSVPIRLEFQSGTLAGGSASSIVAGARTILRSSSTKYVNGLSVVLQGETSWTQGGMSITAGGRVSVPVGAVFVASSDAELSGDTRSRFSVAGTLRVDTCISSPLFSAVCNITGLVESSGAIRLSGHTTFAETSTILFTQLDASVQMTNGQTYFMNASRVYGPGYLHVTGSGHAILAAGTLRTSVLMESSGEFEAARGANVSVVGEFTMNSGRFRGSGITTLLNTFHFNSGSIDAPVHVHARAYLDETSTKSITSRGVLVVANSGVLRHFSGTLSISGRVIIKQEGQFIVEPAAPAEVSSSSGGTLYNTGVITVFGATDDYSMYGVINAGYIYVLRGVLRLRSGTVLESTSEIRGIGNLTISDSIEFGGLISMRLPGYLNCDSCQLHVRHPSTIHGQFVGTSPQFRRSSKACDNSFESGQAVLPETCYVPTVQLAGINTFECVARYSWYEACVISNVNLEVSGQLNLYKGDIKLDGELSVSGELNTYGTHLGRDWNRGSMVVTGRVLVNDDDLTDATQDRVYIRAPSMVEGGTLAVNTSVQASCMAQLGGTIDIRNTTFYPAYQCPSLVSRGGGVLTGFGTIYDDVVCQGCVFNPTDALELDADLTLENATFITRMDVIDGLVNPVTTRDLILDGSNTLNVLVVDDTAPTAFKATSVEAIQATSVTGTFTSMEVLAADHTLTDVVPHPAPATKQTSVIGNSVVFTVEL